MPLAFCGSFVAVALAKLNRYRHNRTGEACPEQPALSVADGEPKGQRDAHLKRPVMGREDVVTVTDGRLDLSAWDRFDRKRFRLYNMRAILPIVEHIGQAQLEVA